MKTEAFFLIKTLIIYSKFLICIYFLQFFSKIPKVILDFSKLSKIIRNGIFKNSKFSEKSRFSKTRFQEFYNFKYPKFQKLEFQISKFQRLKIFKISIFSKF